MRPQGSNPSCTEHCSNRFRFCLRPPGLGPDNDTCPMEQYVTGAISNDNMLFDSERDLGVPNPLVFTGKSWPVSSADKILNAACSKDYTANNVPFMA